MASLTSARQRTALVALVATLLASLTIGASPAEAAGDAAPGWRGDMLRMVNALRVEAGVVPLRPCPSLRRAAQDYAVVMASTGRFSHTGPDGSAPWDRMRAQGFQWRAAGENIAAGQRTVREVMGAWIASPDHHATLVDPDLRQVGFGFATDGSGSGRTYWVQDFGRGSGC